MVTLGRGSDAIGLSDLHLETRLTQYIVGGHVHGDSKADGRAAAAAASAAAGGINSKCSRIKEGHMVNTDVTAPGATLALGYTISLRTSCGIHYIHYIHYI